MNALDAVVIQAFGLLGGQSLRDQRLLADQPTQAVVGVTTYQGAERPAGEVAVSADCVCCRPRSLPANSGRAASALLSRGGGIAMASM